MVTTLIQVKKIKVLSVDRQKKKVSKEGGLG
jgi:hypothetical protein